MPVLFPPPMPRFPCSITRTCGNCTRMRSTVPSVEPLSTTITSRPCTDARHCSIHGSAFPVTTTTVTSTTASRYSTLRLWCTPAEYLFPQDHGEPRQGEQDRHHEEEEATGERRIRAHSEIPEEADEERLAHTQPVDGERHEHDEEEERPEHDVRQHRKVDADRPARRVDREHAGQLQHDADGADEEQCPRMVAVAVNSLVDGARRTFDPKATRRRQRERESLAHGAREEDEPGQDHGDDEDRLGPEVGVDRVAPDREQ